MTKSTQSLVLSAALLLIPLASWAQGSPATEPLTAVERAALSPSRAMLEQGWNVANTACTEWHGPYDPMQEYLCRCHGLHELEVDRQNPPEQVTNQAGGDAFASVLCCLVNCHI